MSKLLYTYMKFLLLPICTNQHISLNGEKIEKKKKVKHKF